MMSQHAKTPYRSVIDPLCVFLTLLLAYLQVLRNVTTGKHAWKALPEVDCGATVEFAAVLAGWNVDKPTNRFRPVWPVEDPDPLPRLSAEDTEAIALDVYFERTQDAATRYQEEREA